MPSGRCMRSSGSATPTASATAPRRPRCTSRRADGAYIERVSLDQFTPAVRDWFAGAFEAPTEAQAQAWPAIASGGHVLISAPTGRGKTLAPLLWGVGRV